MKAKVSLVVIIVLVLSSFVVSNASNITMNVDKESYVVGESATITFENADGDDNAWFAIFPAAGEGKEIYQDYTVPERIWWYANSGTEELGTGATVSGSFTMSLEKFGAGDYRLCYFPDGGYGVGKTIFFEIVEESATPPETTNPSTSDISIFVPIAFVSVALIILKRKEILLNH